MKGWLTTVVVAAGLLWAADALLNDGRYFDVVLLAVTSLGRSIGLPV